MGFRKSCVDSLCEGAEYAFLGIGVTVFIIIQLIVWVFALIMAICETPIAILGFVIGIITDRYPSWAGWKLARKIKQISII